MTDDMNDRIRRATGRIGAPTDNEPKPTPPTAPADPSGMNAILRRRPAGTPPNPKETIPMHDPNLGALRAVLAGYDAGHFSLPGEVIDARDRLATLERLHSASQVSPVAPAAHRAAILALRSGQEPAKAFEKAVAAAEDADRLAQLRLSILAEAIEGVESAVVGAVYDTADAILTAYLAPALAELVAEVRDVAHLAGEIAWQDPRALARSSDAVRVAYEVISAATARYAALREAQSVLARVTGSPNGDAARYFGWAKNVREVWPGFNVGFPTQTAPWPTEAAPRLVWMIQHGIEFWIPTGAQADARYLEFVAASKDDQPHRSPLAGVERVRA